MPIASKIKALISPETGLTITNLSELTGINKGQLSTFVNKNGPLAQDKQVQLVKFLIEQGEAIAARCNDAKGKAALAAKFAELAEFEPYQIRHGEPNPLNCAVLYGQECYIEREADKQLATRLARPFVLAIIGGPKTGKTSFTHHIKVLAEQQGRVVRLDGRQFKHASVVEWLFQVTAEAFDEHFDIHPRDWDEVVDWLVRHVLIGKQPCTFIFDHIEVLGDKCGSLSAGWHHVLNQVRDEPILKTLGLVLVSDQAAQVMHDAVFFGSNLLQRATWICPGNFTKGQVDALLRRVLATNTRPFEFKDGLSVEEVWRKFEGHPFLTHVYVHTFANSAPTQAANLAEKACQRVFADVLWPQLRENVYADQLAAHFRTTADVNLTTSRHQLKLQESGLVHERKVDKKHSLVCTEWVAEQLHQNVRGAI